MKKIIKHVIALCSVLVLLGSVNVYAANYSFSFTAVTGTQYSALAEKLSTSNSYAVNSGSGTLSPSKYITARIANSSKTNISNSVLLTATKSNFTETYTSKPSSGTKVYLKVSASAIGCASTGTWTP